MGVFSTPALQAEWLLNAEYSGFFGTYSLGPGYAFNSRHSLHLSLGAYPHEGKMDYQSNLVYRYTRWSVPVKENTWRPIEIGIFVIRSWNQEKYFLRSPTQYPDDNYYDQTLFRLGLEWSTSFALEGVGLSFSYRFRVLDNGLIALYNNSNKDLQYYTSSGLGIQYHF